MLAYEVKKLILWPQSPKCCVHLVLATSGPIGRRVWSQGHFQKVFRFFGPFSKTRTTIGPNSRTRGCPSDSDPTRRGPVTGDFSRIFESARILTKQVKPSSFTGEQPPGWCTKPSQVIWEILYLSMDVLTSSGQKSGRKMSGRQLSGGKMSTRLKSLHLNVNGKNNFQFMTFSQKCI